MSTPKDDQKSISNEFWLIWNFPNYIGALDGKHVAVEASPYCSGLLYFRYKKQFSIVLMALVDAKYKFIVVDIGAYGKISDDDIFFSSKMGKAFEKNFLNVPYGRVLPETNENLPYAMIEDVAFPLKSYILRP